MSWQEETPTRSASEPVISTIATMNMQTTPLKKGNCFSCGKPGHWAPECPTKRSTGSFSQPNFNTSSVASPGYSEVICRCGAGVCVTFVAKNTHDVYYKCPAQSWMSCGFFVMRNKLDSRGVRQLEYPICECGAGVCLLEREAATGREYFKCRVPKGKGACSFRQWLDEPVSCMKSVTVEETEYLRTPPRLGKRENHPLPVEDDSHRKRLRITELEGSPSASSGRFSSNSVASLVSLDAKEGSSVMSTMELDDISPEMLRDIVEYDYPLTEDDESSCKLQKTPKPEESIASLSPSAQLSPYSAVSFASSNSKEIPGLIETYLQDFDIDEDFINEVMAFESTITNVDQGAELSYDSQMEEVVNTAPAKLPDHETVQRLQANFERRIVTAATDHPQEKCISAMLGAQYLGWLSRLAFASPRCSILPLDKNIFPNFDPIYVPRGIGEFDEGAQSVSNSIAEKSIVVPQESFVEDVPATNLTEPSAPGSPPYVAESDNVIAAAILEAFGQAATLIQTNFIARLESMNPSNHDSMTKEANTVFASFDHLKVDYRPFHQRVKEFIAAAASLNQIELSICNDSLFHDTLDRLNKEKLRLEQLSSEHSSVMKSFNCSQERVQSLINDAEDVRKRLIQIEQQVSAYQMETNGLNIRLSELSDQIKECQKNLQSTSLELEANQKLSLQKETERSAAWDTFEKAKFHLRSKDRAS